MLYKILLIELSVCSSVLCLDEVTKDLLTPIAEYNEFCGYQACPSIRPNYLNVHIVPATHLELGGTATFYQHYEGDVNLAVDDEYGITVKNILDSVITGLWSRRERTFTVTDLPYFFHWWKNRDGTVRRMVYELVRQGRLYFVGGGWGMSDEASANYHAIIDHYTYGLSMNEPARLVEYHPLTEDQCELRFDWKLNATFLECGRPLVTWQADTFGHSREYASLMAQMGFDAHFISPISFDDELSRMRSKSMEFVWRGSDDLGSESDIFTHKLFDGYWSPPGFCFGATCSDPLIVVSDMEFSNVNERVQEFGRLMQVRQGPYYTTNNIMVVMGMRMGYHDAFTWFGNIDQLMRSVNQAKNTGGLRLRLMYSSPACYAQEVQKSQPMLRTKQDDFFPMAYDKDSYVTGMYHCRPTLKYLARELHLFMVIAKQLQMFGHLKNNDVIFEDIQWIAGAMLDHSILPGGLLRFVLNYYIVKVHKAKLLCLKIVQAAINKLRYAPATTNYHICPFNVSSCWTISSHQAYVVIYNPLSWPVTMPVRLPVQRISYNLYDHKGDKVNHSIISIPDIVKTIPERSQQSHAPAMDDELVFIAENLPPMGYRSYYLEAVSLRSKREIIKKMAKSKKRKYLTRQTQSVKPPDSNIGHLYDDKEYVEDVTQKPAKIEFAEVSQVQEAMDDYDNILAPTRRTLGAIKYKLNVTDSEEEEDSLTNSSSFMLPSRRFHLRRTSTSSPLPKRTGWSTTSSTTEEQTTDSTSTTSTTTKSTTTKSITTTNPPSSTPPPDYYDDDEGSYNSTDDEGEGGLSWDDERALRKLERTGYHSSPSADDYIKNEHIKIYVDRSGGKISSIALSNGVYMKFDVNIMYYVSDDPEKLGTKKKNPGAFIFRPMDPNPEPTSKHSVVKILLSDIVEEVQIQFSPYAAVSLRLYKNLPYIEVDWVVGPIPVINGLGKEVFVRYATDLKNNGVFYTDSNGRQTIKRIKNMRPTFNPVNTDDIAGNFYPITSKVYIEDVEKNMRFSVFPDRSEGCTSLNQGQLDIMLHRRILTDDTSVTGHVNDILFDGKGVVVRGNHRLYLSKADYKPNKFFEKKFAKELELHPQIFTSSHPIFDRNMNYANWSEYRNEYTVLKKKLPMGVHIMTFEKWSEQLLIRLENYLELNDVVKSGVKIVNILGLFKNYIITNCRETMLGTNIWRSDYAKMQWQSDKFVKNFNDMYGNSSNLKFVEDDSRRDYDNIDLKAGIELVPQQIRTFVCDYEHPQIKE